MHNIETDKIRAAMAEEYAAAKTAIEQANPGLLPGEVAAAMEDQGWKHLDGQVGESLYGYHQPGRTGGYSTLVQTNCVAFQYATGSPSCHGLVVVKDAAA